MVFEGHRRRRDVDREVSRGRREQGERELSWLQNQRDHVSVIKGLRVVMKKRNYTLAL